MVAGTAPCGYTLALNQIRSSVMSGIDGDSLTSANELLIKLQKEITDAKHAALSPAEKEELLSLIEHIRSILLSGYLPRGSGVIEQASNIDGLRLEMKQLTDFTNHGILHDPLLIGQGPSFGYW